MKVTIVDSVTGEVLVHRKPDPGPFYIEEEQFFTMLKGMQFSLEVARKSCDFIFKDGMVRIASRKKSSS